MKIIDVQPGSEEWLDWRKGGVGASDVAALCGVCPHKTAYDIYLEKLGLDMTSDNEWMKRGRDNEASARYIFEGIKDVPFPAINIEHSQFTHFKASLDGYNHEYREVLEIKVPGLKALKMAEDGQVPTNYLYQIQWQIFVADAQKAHLFVYHPETMTYYHIHIERDNSLIDMLVEVADKFWADLQNGIAPEDPKETRFLTVARSRELFEEMIEQKEISKKAEDRCKLLRDELFELEGEDISLESEHAIFRRIESQRIDYKQAAIDAKVDLEKYKLPKTISWSIKIK